LVIARLVQGLAGGTLTPQISASIQELFRGAERGKAFGLFGAIVGLSTAVGPLAGGLLIAAFGDTEGWRWVFYVNVPIGLAAMPLAWRLLPKASEEKKRREHTYDPVGVVLLGVGAVLLLLPFVQEREWSGNTKWLLVPLAALILVSFVLWDLRYAKRGKEPLVDLRLFQRPSYTFGISLITVYFAGFTALFFVFTLYLQIGLQYSALAAGLAITPFALGSGAAAALGGRVVHRYGRPLVAVGLLLVTAGLIGSVVAVHLVPSNGTGWATLLPLTVAGLGGGLVIAPNQALTLDDVPVERAGTAGGLLQTGQRLGAAIGIAAVGSAFFSRLASTRGDYAAAFERGVEIMLVFIVASLVIATADIVFGRRTQHGRHEADKRQIEAGTTAA
jgi:MFS family permease